MRTTGRCETDEAPAMTGPYIMGVDLSDGAAMCATGAYWPLTGLVDGLAAFPEIPDPLERGRADQVGRLYADMVTSGDLLLTPGRAVDVPTLIQESLRRWGRPVAVVADRHRRRDLVQELVASGFRSSVVVDRGMGWIDGAEDVRKWRRALLERQLKIPKKLVLRSAMTEAVVMVNPAGDAKIAKHSQGGRRARAKDDVACAIVLAVAEGVRRAPKLAAPRPPLRIAVLKRP